MELSCIGSLGELLVAFSVAEILSGVNNCFFAREQLGKGVLSVGTFLFLEEATD